MIAAAPSLLIAGEHRAATILVPGLPMGLPSFYSDLFAPFAKELISDAALLGNSNLAVFSSASVCCVNSLDRINRTAARELVHAIRRHHLQPAGAAGGDIASPSRELYLPRAQPLPPISSQTIPRMVVSIVDRAVRQRPSSGTSDGGGSSGGSGGGASGRAFASRAITDVDTLLSRCNHRARSCSRLRFPPEVPFKAALSALHETDLLVGAHGAGLANAVFMREGASVVEILPAGFAQPGSFALTPDKYGWLSDLGIRRLRLVADETRPRLCASESERTRKVWERLRDCDVTVSWQQVEDVLLVGRPADAAQRRGAGHGSTAAATPPPKTLSEEDLGWRCTIWPGGAQVGSDEARCLLGNRYNDGYTYIHNAHRGTPQARCGARAQCTCCRRPKKALRTPNS